MQLVIIEDEVHNLRLLQGMLQTMRPDWEVVATFESVKQSVKWLGENPQPELILMDIQLSDGICFSIFEQLEVTSAIIFTTAFDNYAIRAFKVNSIDYLLKPIKESELEKALLKFEQQKKNSTDHLKQLDYLEMIKSIRSGQKEFRKRFMISFANKYAKLNTSEIAYFISENKITTAVTFTNEKYIIDFTLERLEEELNPDDFFRTDRKSILNIDAISRFEDYFGGKLVLKLKTPFNEKITVSRLKASAFKMWIGK
ncbi:MAG: LytR/AlgR family response regulator transcription factor [Prolixibacteraceae bacterium]